MQRQADLEVLKIVSTHSRLKAAGPIQRNKYQFDFVSTHSRLKAAGYCRLHRCACLRGFNTQPPEGGWSSWSGCSLYSRVSTHSRLKAAGRYKGRWKDYSSCFNTQPPEGGWS